jgi:hypothetical protein
MSHLLDSNWWNRQHINTRILIVTVVTTFVLFTVVQIIGVTNYDVAPSEAMQNMGLVVGVAILAVCVGLALRHKKYVPAALGLCALLLLDLGTWRLSARPEPLVPITLEYYAMLAAFSLGVWWWTSRS